MRIECPECGAHYRVPDEKLCRDETRARCKRCGQKMLIQKVSPGEREVHVTTVSDPETPAGPLVDAEEPTMISRVSELSQVTAQPPWYMEDMPTQIDVNKVLREEEALAGYQPAGSQAQRHAHNSPSKTKRTTGSSRKATEVAAHKGVAALVEAAPSAGGRGPGGSIAVCSALPRRSPPPQTLGQAQVASRSGIIFSRTGQSLEGMDGVSDHVAPNPSDIVGKDRYEDTPPNPMYGGPAGSHTGPSRPPFGETQPSSPNAAMHRAIEGGIEPLASLAQQRSSENAPAPNDPQREWTPEGAPASVSSSPQTPEGARTHSNDPGLQWRAEGGSPSAPGASSVSGNPDAPTPLELPFTGSSSGCRARPPSLPTTDVPPQRRSSSSASAIIPAFQTRGAQLVLALIALALIAMLAFLPRAIWATQPVYAISFFTTLYCLQASFLAVSDGVRRGRVQMTKVLGIPSITCAVLLAMALVTQGDDLGFTRPQSGSDLPYSRTFALPDLRQGESNVASAEGRVVALDSPEAIEVLTDQTSRCVLIYGDRYGINGDIELLLNTGSDGTISSVDIASPRDLEETEFERCLEAGTRGMELSSLQPGNNLVYSFRMVAR